MDLLIIDDALEATELAYWQEKVQTGTQSTTMLPEEYEGTELYRRATSLTRQPLIHALLFDIVKGMDTEVHQDIGELSILFFPFDNAKAPLHIEYKSEPDVAVKANRLVVFDCALFPHQQVVPQDDSHRHSVVFKFDTKV